MLKTDFSTEQTLTGQNDTTKVSSVMLLNYDIRSIFAPKRFIF